MVGAARFVAGPHRQVLSPYILLVAVSAIGMVALIYGFSMVAGKQLPWLGRWRDC